MADKRSTIDEAIGELRDGMTIGIGGWGSRRKPMALVRAIARSNLRDLTIVSYGGPDVGLLCATNKVRRVVYGFVSLDSIPLEPHFRRARETAAIEVTELDEGMLYWGLYAASLRLPFLPSRIGLGSDVLTHNPQIKTVCSPYADGEELVAVPAIPLDVAMVHLHRADQRGNAAFLGQDLYFDDLFCRAAARTFLSCEQIVATADLTTESTRRPIHRMMVSRVIETRRGAHFTECQPDYGRDETFQKEYAATAKDAATFAAFRAKYIDVDESQYQKAIG